MPSLLIKRPEKDQTIYLLNQENKCSSIYLGLIKVGKEAILKICVAYKQCRIISFLFYCNVQFIFQCVLVRLALGIEINKATKLTKKLITSRYEQLDSSDSSSQSILELHLLANGMHSPK